MGNSTIKLQNVVDYVSTIGDLMTTMPVGGFSNLLALNIANDVLTEFLSQRFNFKFNRVLVNPFYTISLQQDYVGTTTTIGWLEHSIVVDINNTAKPKPIFPIEAKKDLERTSYQFGKPCKVCWLPNDQLVQDVWPGAQQKYTNPLGATGTPSNPITNIRDANNNILYVSTYGTTGLVAPVLAANSAAGTQVVDGSVIWKVADPKAQGFRVSPLPPQAGVVYQVYIVAQAKPIRFTSLDQTLDPITDDFAKYFQDGYIAYAHRHSTAPVVTGRFEQKKADWLQSISNAMGAADRESTDIGIYPDRSIMQSDAMNLPIGPAWPFQY
jgi:hypothetical protein